ncbi:MAG: hypothetical protein ABG776_02465 [Cyanobacteria bacterium J06555_13]
MSSAASRPPHTASLSAKAEGQSDPSKSNLRKPPNRSLLQPPARPKPPVRPPTPPAVPAQSAPVEAPPKPQRPGPISLPSEPMQYRAIGLLKGKYIASEEQFNRGDIAASDGTLIDAVLLGRVTSLIKKHLDLDKDHLWVVYPRTLYKDKDDAQQESEHEEKESAPEKYDDSEEKIPALHVQIVGVWEPETLNPEANDEEDELRPLSSEEAEEQCNQFSIRGEIAKYSEEDNEILVNIVQKSKSETTKPKRPFKLLVNGQLTGRTVGYFWDLQVERQEGKLILKEGKSIAVVPPKKKAKGKKGGSRRRPPMNGKPKASNAPKPKPKPKTGETERAAVDETPAVEESSEV